MSPLPPRHLCIAGALLIAMGAAALAEKIASLIHGRWSNDIGFLLIFAGYGLLIGRPRARKWVLVIAIASLACMVVAGGCAAHEQWKCGGRVPLSPDDASAVAEWIWGVAFCLYLSITLTRSAHREWFAEEKKWITTGKEDRTPVKSLAWAAAVVGMVFGYGEIVDAWRVKERYEKAGAFRVRLSPYSAAKGKGLTTLTYECDEVSHTDDAKPKLPRVRAIFIGGEDGPHFEFYGEAAQPFDVTLKSEGFQDKTVTLCGKTEYEIRVPMQPLDAGKGAVVPAAKRADSD